MVTPPGDLLAREYEALVSGVGLIDVGDRTQIELTGGDRATFLHNLLTNDVKVLVPGGGCEAFVTNVQGKILGHVHVFVGSESIVLETVPDQAVVLLTHLEKYLIREDVQIHDRTAEWGELLLAGPKATATWASRTGEAPPEELFSHKSASIDDRVLHIRRVDLLGPECFLIQAAVEDADVVAEALVDAGSFVCGSVALNTVRIECGTPFYGRDITDKNLPQEVNRDRRAISFTKGCYLGQETVARLDALGHVNRLLVGVAFEGKSVPEPGTSLTLQGSEVGRVTSSCFSPKLARPLALAYVRREHHEPGTRLDSPVAAAEIVRLPF